MYSRLHICCMQTYPCRRRHLSKYFKLVVTGQTLTPRRVGCVALTEAVSAYLLAPFEIRAFGGVARTTTNTSAGHKVESIGLVIDGGVSQDLAGWAATFGQTPGNNLSRSRWRISITTERNGSVWMEKLTCACTDKGRADGKSEWDNES